VSVNSPLSNLELLNQFLWNLVFVSWYFSLSQRRSSYSKSHPSVCVSVSASPYHW
jgi:hypothetical protein